MNNDMDIIATLNKSIIILKSLRPNVDQINDITLPIINVVNDLAAVRDVLASQQEESHENNHNEERDV